jgi:hypothetical protein
LFDGLRKVNVTGKRISEDQGEKRRKWTVKQKREEKMFVFALKICFTKNTKPTSD